MKSISALLLSPLRPFILFIVSSPFSPFPISITLLMWHTLLSSSFIYKNISFSRLSNLSCPYISSASFCPRLSKEFFNNRMLLHNSDHYANLSFIHTIKKKNASLSGSEQIPSGWRHMADIYFIPLLFAKSMAFPKIKSYSWWSHRKVKKFGNSLLYV